MKTQPMYLERIAIQDFRSFGPDFAIDLPRGPGLTVIVGANGLGKSSFFDAIEWAFTGKLQRLDATDGNNKDRADALARRISEGYTQPAVQLHFTDGVIIDRSRENASSSLLSGEDVIKQLISDNWIQLGDPTPYLFFTHFLGQSSNQRFLHRESKDRFSYIEGPSRLLELRELQQKISRRRLTQDIQSMEREIREEQNNLQERISEWQSLMQRHKSLKLLAEAGRALSPEEVITECETLASLLANQWQCPVSLITGLPAAKAITMIRAIIEQKELSTAAKQMQLETLIEKEEPFRILEREVSDFPALELLHSTEIDLLISKQNGLTKFLEEEKVKANDIYEKQMKEIAHLQTLQKLREQLTKKSGLESTFLKLMSEFSDKEKAKSLLLVELELQREQVNKSEQAELERTLVIERQQRVHVLQTQLDTLIGLEKNSEVLALEWSALLQPLEDVKAALAVIGDEKKQILLDKTIAEQNLVNVRATAEVLAMAVASIAQALPDDATECPVCKINHPEGKLKKLASVSALATDQAITIAIKKLDQLKTRLAEINRQEELLIDKRVKFENIRTSFFEAMESVTTQFDALALEIEFVGRPKQEYQEYLTTEKNRVEASLLDISKRVATIGKLNDQKAALSNILDKFAESEELFQLCKTQIADTQSEIQNLSDGIEAIIKVLVLPQDWLENLATLVSDSAEQIETFNRLLQEQQTLSITAELELQDLILKIDKLKKKQTELPPVQWTGD